MSYKVWVLLALLLAPAVAVTVDTVSVAQQANTFSPAAPTLQSTATYDIAVSSTEFGDRLVRDGLRMSFDEVAPSPADQGRQMSVRVERFPAPWDAEAPAVAHHPGPAVGARQSLQVRDVVHLDSGIVLERQEMVTDRRWHEEDDVWLAGVVQNLTTARPHGDGGPFPAVERILALSLRHEPQGLYERTVAAHDGTKRPTVHAARFDGKPVYVVNLEGPAEKGLDVAFGCDVDVPYYHYEEAETTESLRGHEIWRQTTQRLVFREESFFPLLATCESVFHRGGPGGEELGSVRVVARLASHEKGQEVIAIGEGPRGGKSTDVAVSSAAIRRNVTGLPYDPDPLFLFPLDRAYNAVRDSTDEVIAGFRDTGAVPFVVRTARYDPDDQVALCEPYVLADCLLEARERLVVAEPMWQLEVQNRAGEILDVTILQQMIRSGERLPPQIVTVEERGVAPELLDHSTIPRSLVPPSKVLAPWVQGQYPDQEQAEGLEAWRVDREAAFHISYPTSAGAAPVYALTASYEPEDVPPGQPFEPFEPYASRQLTNIGGDTGVVRDVMFHIEAYRKSPTPSVPSDVYIDLRHGLVQEPHESTLALVAGGLTFAAVVVTGRAYAGDRWLRLLLLPLFTRLNRENVLDNEIRERMLNFVTENPGVRTQEVRAHLGIGWGTVIYHLGMLEQHELVCGYTLNGRRYWFTNKTVSAAQKQALAVLRSRPARRCYHVVQEHPGATQRQVADLLGVTHGAIIFHARRLERAGLITKVRQGRVVRYFAKDVVEPNAHGAA